MELKISVVQRKLDAKLKIAGLEAPDLFSVLILAAVLNLIFGQTPLAIPVVLVFPSILLLILYFGKRDKPDGFLVHLLRFHMTPGFYAAGLESKNEYLKRRRIV